MCGIVGVVGNTNATDILIQGLEKLEYRGYDSAGIFVAGDASSQLVKAVGRIAELAAKTEGVEGTAGIGHTRWATHGKPTEDNAHPHRSETERFVLVHNGVIENYLEIKEEYLAGHHFKGQTDTEIAVHLIGKFVEEDGLSTLEAFKKALHIIRGSYAFALMDSEDASTIYVAKNKSPLLIGLGDGYNMVCSDAMAMIRETNQYMEIHDQELVIVKADSVEVQDYDGNVKERDSYTAELDLSDIGKGTYPYYMLKEIDEQPTVMRKLIQAYTDDKGQVTVDTDIIKAVQEADRIYILAAGTSYHAGFASKKMLEELTDTPVELGISSEWGYGMPLLSKKPLFVFISQSGETADTKAALHLAHEKGAKVLSVVNVKGSSIARESDMVLYTHAGPEISVASTKAFSVQMSVMYLLAFEMAYAKGHIDENECKRLTAKLAEIPDIIEKTMECEKRCKYVSSKLITAQSLLYIGRGLDYALSMEGSLKLKEISYIHSESYAAGELKHGTISLVEEGMPVIGVATQTELLEKTVSNIVEVKSRGAFTIVVCKEGTEFSEGVIDEAIEVPAMEDVLMPMLTVIPLQLIAYYTTVLKGLNVDKPRNLAKSVTVE